MGMSEEQPMTDEQEVSSSECEHCHEYKDGWQRALADYDNLKKDLSKERDQMRSSMIEYVCHELLPLIDNFDQAIRFVPEDAPEGMKGWIDGVRHVRAQFTDVLSRLGIESFGEVGDAFDPNKHESVGEQEGGKSGTIAEVTSLGWKKGEKILRPASVVINK